MTSAIQVIVADDQELFRRGLVALLAGLPGVTVVAEASNGQEVVAVACELRPHVVLMDLRMPVLDGVAATQQLRSLAPDIHVVILTTFDDDRSIFAAIQAGAVGYLLKDTSARALSDAIEHAARGEAFLTPKVATRLVHRVAAEPLSQATADPMLLASLTPKEREVLRHLARGASNKEIASALRVTEGTVKNHVTAIFQKLGVSDRLQAALVARELGIDARADR